MKIDIPDIPRDRPLNIFDGRGLSCFNRHDEVVAQIGPWAIVVCNTNHTERGIVLGGHNPGWHLRMARDNFQFLFHEEVKSLGLPKLETRRNGDKLEVWAVDWE